MARGADVQIIEYHNGRPMHQYDGVQECASTFHCHTELIKGLIYTGQAFPYLEENITFDIHPDSNYRIIRRPQSLCKTTRFYMFDIVEDDLGEEGGDIEKRDEGKNTDILQGTIQYRRRRKGEEKV